MNRNMKILLIGAAIMLFVVGGTVWQVVEVNRSGRSPLAVLFEDEATPPPLRSQPLSRLFCARKHRRQNLPQHQLRNLPEPTPEVTRTDARSSRRNAHHARRS